ncbi:hypothetical protein CLV92_12323 [Kineococcus xinjiangensis]|uniref:Uncharacterized protein n=1 Tax=Kineococcus xinjiangensis TaxID=512762 RepID=A0A2S6IC40_9ACTN|nr:hypothetical protein [Kineococcus xinjiangensis]PPK90819.1 hypothetical protein CLV92_12323 [Kineococcus xinjiangensis]
MREDRSADDERMSRDLLTATDPLPDIGALVGRAVDGGRRRLRRRRLTVAAGGTSLTVVAALLVLSPPDLGDMASTDDVRLTAPSELGVRSVVEARQQAALLTEPFNEALETALPGWPAAEGDYSRSADGPYTGWVFTSTNTEAPVTELTVRVEGPAAGTAATRFCVPAESTPSMPCTQRTLPDGTELHSGLTQLSITDEHGDVVTSTPPFARANLPDGRTVLATVSIGEPGAVSADSVALPAGSPLTTAALEELVTAPQLAQMPLP